MNIVNGTAIYELQLVLYWIEKHPYCSPDDVASFVEERLLELKEEQNQINKEK